MIITIHLLPVAGGLDRQIEFTGPTAVADSRVYLNKLYSKEESDRMVNAAFARYVPPNHPDQLDLNMVGVLI